MRRERNRPSHSLDEAKRLAREHKLSINKRARDFIRNRCGRLDAGTVVSELFESIAPENFYKSEALEILPGEWGDVYRHVPYDGEEWYVKFLIREDGTAVLSVLSANWEGLYH